MTADAKTGRRRARETRHTRFVILAAPRTGSNWLCTMLNSHPEIVCHHELFNPQGIHYALDHRSGDLHLGSKEERDRSPLAFLDRLWREDFGKRAIGFKLNRGQNEEVFKKLVADTGIQKLVLVRKNRIKTFVSERIASSTGRWESYLGLGDALQTVKVRVELTALFEHISVNESYYSQIHGSLETTGQRSIEIAYEDLCAGKDWERVLRFLKVARRGYELKAGTRKQTARDLREVIVNFEELEDALSGSHLEAELHSVDF
jgi:LPS sulfotransferase NodH